jgi:hypothetical protein
MNKDIVTRKAVVVGINDYPRAKLKGCVNDANIIADYLTVQLFQVTKLLDGAATRDAIANALISLCNNAVAGDTIVFHYSGHGTSIPIKAGVNDPTESDHTTEGIVPVDAIGNDNNVITDNQFYELFSAVPSTVKIELIFDCCHSGTISRSLNENCQVRYYPAAGNYTGTRAFVDTSAILDNLVLWAGCADSELALDVTMPNGIIHGAFTWALLRARIRYTTRRDIITEVENIITNREWLHNGPYYQHPQLECAISRVGESFLNM